MKNPFGFGIAAIAATASLALAGGDEEKNKVSSSLEKLGAPGTPAKQEVTFAPGKGVTFDAGDDFMLNLSTYVQVLWTYIANDSTNPASNGGSADFNTFAIKKARTALKGHLFNKDIRYRLAAEWTDSTNPVKDAWVHWMFHSQDTNAIGLRAGQQKTFFGRESTSSDTGVEFADRALASRTFANTRARGAAVTGGHVEGKKFNWTAGAFNTDSAGASAARGEDNPNTDNELNWVFTARFDGNGDMGDEGYMAGDLENTQELKWSVGAGYQIGNARGTVGAATRDIDSATINLNGGLKIKGWHVLAEYFMRSDEPDVAGSSESESNGWQAQASYTMAAAEGSHSQWSFGARISSISLDDASQILLNGTALGASEGDVDEITFMATNYYRKYALKTTAAWTLQSVDPTGGSSADNHIFEVQFQFIF